MSVKETIEYNINQIFSNTLPDELIQFKLIHIIVSASRSIDVIIS